MSAQKKVIETESGDRNIVFITSVDTFNQGLRELLVPLGFSIEIYPGFGAWRSQESLKKICGIIVDFKTLMTTDPDNRSWFEQIKTVFPVLTIFPSKSELGFRVTYSDRGLELKEEIIQHCQSTLGGFCPTAVRRHVRYDRYFRALVQTRKKSEVVFRGYTLNISMGGLYIVLNDAESLFSVEDIVKIQLLDIYEEGAQEPLVITGSIRFIRSWDNSINSQPGIGVMADDEYLRLLKAIVRNQLGIRR